MDIKRLTTEEVQDFIQQHMDHDVKKLALSKHNFEPEFWKEILVQIQAKQKSKTKLSTWYHSENIIYPSTVSIEQTSSEFLAKYKANQLSGNTIIDLTGGFGVDAYYFSERFQKVIHCEWNTSLSDLVKHNFEILKRKNITCISGDSSETLKNISDKIDWIYIDPARRDNHQQKVFRLEDCSPNVIDDLDMYFDFSDHILIKTAPLLDITLGYEALKNVWKVEIVSLQNEVKEILWFLKKGFEDAPKIVATDIDKNKKIFHFETYLKDIQQVDYSLPLKYLYEPLNVMLKAGSFNHIGAFYGLKKLEKHTHLYTSDHRIDFPGRVFEITEVIPFQKKEIKKRLSQKKAHISTRNFLLKPEEIRKKFDVKDGGDDYVFFVTLLHQEKVMLLCNKI